VGVLLLVNCCVAELVRKPWYHQRSMTDGTIFRGGQPFRRPGDGIIDGCEDGGGRNWMGSCGA
jgi:hypothetical protein